MKLEQLIILLPCHSLEDFTLRRSTDEAEQLLCAWSSLWHPALLADAQVVPGWRPAEDPPEDLAGHLVTLPDCCKELLPADWLETAEASGACVLHGMQDRRQMVAAALEHLDEPDAKVDPEIVADFHA
ncbi:hypothetical protein LCGC14_2987790, partial [marine sediment metagenome]